MGCLQFSFQNKMVAYLAARIVVPIHLLAYFISEASTYLFSFDVYWSGLGVFLSTFFLPWPLQRRTVDIGSQTKSSDSKAKVILFLDNLFFAVYSYSGSYQCISA